jgi:hypothetical protein
MVYYPSREVADEESALEIHGTCMCCGAEAEGPLVAYDLTLPGNRLARALFHRDCAFAMAQRIICDTWPKRRDKTLMGNDR